MLLNRMKQPFAVIFFPLFLLSTLNFLWFQPYKASVYGNETDHLALLKFKESISDDLNNILASWNSSTHFCSWYGITCSHRHQRVTELILKGYQLQGFISPHVANLSFLTRFALDNNNIHGEIPSELTHLRRLQVLDFSNNTLSGQILVNLTGLSKLRFLSFGGNHLTGEIPMEIGSLHKLEELLLPINNLTGQIPSYIWNLTSLRIISITYNHLEGNIPEQIGLWKNLTKFSVGNNKLSGTLPSSLYNLSSLTEISIEYNQFVGSLPANMFSTLPNIHFLATESNNFSGTIPTSITNASFLQVLAMGSNGLVGQIPSLGKLGDLLSIFLYDNSLGSNSPKSWEFLKSLSNCSELYFVDIAINNFGGPLPSTIGNLSTKLAQLRLDSNKISGEVPEELGNLINMTKLTLDHNYFVETIPTTFGKFQKMQVLSLGQNQLFGEIPSSIGNLNQLIGLDLSQNMLQGPIPPSIGNCQNLRYLDLSQNNLSGAIPAKVIGLSSLSILLNLSSNLLNGSLPVTVGKLKNINTLDVSRNHLSGHIPETIAECISLEYLYLQANSFQGRIPYSMASLKGLRYLDLSQNNLSGTIPKGLQGIFGLGYLNLSFNMLDGEVPNKGVFGNASAISLIENNQLCGGISELHLPPCPTIVMKHGEHGKVKLIVVIISVATFFLLLSTISAIYLLRRSSKKSFLNSPTIDGIEKVSYQSLHNATHGFSNSNLIGSGSFGTVYRGSLEFEVVVAIKVLHVEKKGAHKSFLAECNAMRNTRHRNLVKVLTCCLSIDYKGHAFKALVYEYMMNGSLEKWLHPDTQTTDHSRNFLFNQRLNIVIDVASALHYLHYECEQPIVHCDIKPSNILLDGDMVAHASDFGLARLISTVEGISSKKSSTIGINGTVGYSAPEYGMGSEVSKQGDMYSFGILILEMFTGRRPTNEIFTNGQNLHNYVEHAFPDHLLQIVDPNLFSRHAEQTKTDEEENNEILILNTHPNVEKSLVSIFKIGLDCSVESPNERLSIADVAKELNQIRNAFLS